MSYFSNYNNANIERKHLFFENKRDEILLFRVPFIKGSHNPESIGAFALTNISDTLYYSVKMYPKSRLDFSSVKSNYLYNGFLLCDGKTYDVNKYYELFKIIQDDRTPYLLEGEIADILYTPNSIDFIFS